MADTQPGRRALATLIHGLDPTHSGVHVFDCESLADLLIDAGVRVPDDGPRVMAEIDRQEARCLKPHWAAGQYRDRQRIEDWNDGVHSLARELRAALVPEEARHG